MARPRPVEVLHLVDLEVLVGDQQGDGAAQRDAPPDAGKHLDLVGFNLLPSAAAIAALPPRQLGVDVLDVQVNTRGKAIDQGQQGPAVRFTGGKIAQHGGQF